MSDGPTYPYGVYDVSLVTLVYAGRSAGYQHLERVTIGWLDTLPVSISPKYPLPSLAHPLEFSPLEYRFHVGDTIESFSWYPSEPEVYTSFRINQHNPWLPMEIRWDNTRVDAVYFVHARHEYTPDRLGIL